MEKYKTYQMNPMGVQCAVDMGNGGGFVAVDEDG
jgi:hypothetical protein